MRELSLFSGAGGGLLGTHCLLGWRTVGYVEINEYCQQVIKQRIADGYLDEAPIFGDIRSFIDQGYAGAYTGMVDVITAGFPCQGFSPAGRQLGEFSDKNKWPETIKTIDIIRPKFLLLENSSRILSFQYYEKILTDLQKCGYRFAYQICLPGWIGNAPHIGKRWWFVVSPMCERLERIYEETGRIPMQSIEINFPRNIRKTTPRVFRRGDELADRVERTIALGNGQVPSVAATAWRLLTEEN